MNGTTHDRGYVLKLATDHPFKNGLGYVREHILIAEQALGRYLPEGVEVHHFNGVKDDNGNQNLVICENRAYHRLLHQRQRVVAHGGDPDKEKICTICKKVKSRESFARHRGNADGLQPICKQCRSEKYGAYARAYGIEYYKRRRGLQNAGS